MSKIEAVKASLELRLDQATHHVKEVAQEAAVIAALSVIAAITSAMTVARRIDRPLSLDGGCSRRL
jgi:hypothetical protein